MTAGLPGTGISSIFYFLLTLFMPLGEFVALCKGKSSWKRWRFIGRQWAMLGGMILGMWGWSWLVNQFCMMCVELYAYVTGQSIDDLLSTLFLRKTGAILFASAFGSLISLTLVISTMFVLRSVIRWRKANLTIQSATAPAAGLQPTLAPAGLAKPMTLEPVK